MKNRVNFFDAMRHTRVLRPPKHTIATFGTTTLNYILLSLVPGAPDQCRLRAGEVTAQRPQILTPEFFKNQFQGFGDDTEEIKQEMEKIYGQNLKGLQYSFRNNLKSTSLEHATLLEVADRTQKVMDAEGAPRSALLEGPDGLWSVSIMKFIIDTSIRSFPVNMRELDEHGLFNPGKAQETRERFEIEKLFQLAQRDRSQIPRLAELLKQQGKFSDYEDRFFALVQS